MAVKTFQFTLESYIAREAATMAVVNHQNVVKFLGFEKVHGDFKQVLIMEQCEGNLQDFIEKNPNGLGDVEVMRFCHDLVAAMRHLRTKNVVHRDVKPANILLMHHSGQTIYKLADFGAARFLEANESYGSLYGTFEYVHPDIFAKFYYQALDIYPPKQVFNDNHELWSLGVTFFEAASGRLPFEPKNGRADKKLMYHMIADKENDCICAKEVDGEIEWSQQLPENCDLENSLKQTVTPLIVGLLRNKNMWSFDQFFDEVSIVLSPTSASPLVIKNDNSQPKNKRNRTRMQKYNMKELRMPLRARRNRTRVVGKIPFWRRRPFWLRPLR